jgi:hypothetical protein
MYPPPHPEIASNIRQRSSPIIHILLSADCLRDPRFVPLTKTIPTRLIEPSPVQNANIGAAGSCLPAGILSAAFGPAVAMVKVEVTGPPFGVTVAGEKVHIAKEGSPEQAKVTGLLNPPVDVTVKTNEADCPALIVALDGLAAMLKSGVSGEFTVCVRADEVLPVKFVLPPYTAVMECAPNASNEVL